MSHVMLLWKWIHYVLNISHTYLTLHLKWKKKSMSPTYIVHTYPLQHSHKWAIRIDLFEMFAKVAIVACLTSNCKCWMHSIIGCIYRSGAADHLLDDFGKPGLMSKDMFINKFLNIRKDIFLKKSSTIIIVIFVNWSLVMIFLFFT